LIVLLGVYPKPVIDRITPSVNRLVDRVEQVTHVRQPAVATTPATSTASAP
jgi:NADH:ubiquinone oxidoreductase subunit 4 (subunit M)